MKKLSCVVILVLCIMVLSSCRAVQKKNAEGFSEKLKAGDGFTVTGMVDFSDKPSDIGEQYCFVTVEEEIEYFYIDIYGEEAEWSSDTVYTRGDDTEILKQYIGKRVTVSGLFQAESHGIPYITNIEVQP